MFKSSNIHTPHSKPKEQREINKMEDLQPINGGESSSDSTQSSENDVRGQNPASRANLKPFGQSNPGNPTGYFPLTVAQKGCRIHGWNRHNQQREVPPDNTFFPRVERWISHNKRRLLNE